MKAETKTETLAEFCTICDRVMFGEIVRVGYGKWRHDYCAIGSTAWLVYYNGLSEEKKKPLRHFFELKYPQVGGNDNETT